jgi:hypothetical protein
MELIRFDVFLHSGLKLPTTWTMQLDTVFDGKGTVAYYLPPFIEVEVAIAKEDDIITYPAQIRIWFYGE